MGATSSPGPRRGLALIVSAATLWVAACASGGAQEAATPVPAEGAAAAEPAKVLEPVPTTTVGQAAPQSDVISRLRSLPSAAGIPAVPDSTVAPTTLRLPSLGVEGAAVRPVGVEPNGEMEIPAATEVGWYRFGPQPGESGSAVLAAHIAADGVDGVFRYLDRLEPGERVEVGYSDGATAEFEIVELQQYDKDELPDDLFARDGASQLVLITCGGDFNSEIRSYEDNVVAYAVPV